MKYYDPRVERAASLIVYHVQTNEGLELSGKSLHDIFSNVRTAISYWKDDSDKIRKENHALRWHELRIWIRENPTATSDDISSIMLHLDEGEYVRDIRVR